MPCEVLRLATTLHVNNASLSTPVNSLRDAFPYRSVMKRMLLVNTRSSKTMPISGVVSAARQLVISELTANRHSITRIRHLRHHPLRLDLQINAHRYRNPS